MKKVGIALSIVMALALIGCGTGTSSSVINGTWTATLTDSSTGATNFSFTVGLTDAGNDGVSVTNLAFNTASPCFGSSTTATGSFTLSGTTNGVNSGTFKMTVLSGPSANINNDALNLQGTLNNNTITGNWTLIGPASGCTGSGTFTMNRM
jgi:hypothetical protein